MQLSTGLVIAGAYADKLRKTLFAQLRDRMKAGEVTGTEIARAAGEINRFIYEVLVDRLKLDKGDVVRVRVEYDVRDGRIEWRYETLTIEAFRRVPEDEVRKAIEAARAEEARTPEYRVRKVGDTPLGDEIYDILENDRVIGRLVATPVDKDVIVRGALRDPPAKIERTRIVVSGSMEQTLSAEVRRLVQGAKPVDREEAEKILREIDELLS